MEEGKKGGTPIVKCGRKRRKKREMYCRRRKKMYGYERFILFEIHNQMHKLGRRNKDMNLIFMTHS